MKIRDRKKTSIEWASLNPILPLGAEGVDTTTNKVKIGNGITTWNDLPYISGNHNYRGVFTSLNELENSITLPKEGDVADIDTEGTDIVRYVWDITDEKWVPQKTSVMNVAKASSADVIAGTDDINYMTVERTIEAISLNTSGNSDKLENKVTGTSVGDIVVQGDKYIKSGDNTIYSPSEFTGYTANITGVWGIDSNGLIPNSYYSYVTITGVSFDGAGRYNPFTVSFSVSVNSVGSLTVENVLKSHKDIPFSIYKESTSNRIKAVFNLSISFRYLKINVSSINTKTSGVSDTLNWVATDSVEDYTEVIPTSVRSLMHVGDFGLGEDTGQGQGTGFSKTTSLNGAIIFGSSGDRTFFLYGLGATGELRLDTYQGSSILYGTRIMIDNQTEQIMSNKTLTGLKEVISDLGNVSGTVNINCAQGNLFKMTLTGNITGFTFTNINTSAVQNILLDISPNGYSINFSQFNVFANHTLPTIQDGNNLLPILIYGNGTAWI